MSKPPSKQNLFIALAIASLVAVEGMIIVGGLLAHEAMDLRRHTHEALIAISEVNERKDHTESIVREFVVTGSETLGQRAEKNAAEIHTRLAHARQLMGDNTNQVRRLDRLDASLKELTTRWTTTLATRRTQGKDAAEKLVSEGIGRQLSDEAENILGEMEAEENRLLTERSARADEYSKLCSHSAKLGGALTVLFGFLAWRTLRRETTARAEAAIHLQHAMSRQEMIFKSIGDGLHGLDPDGTINFENEASDRMLGYAKGELLGKPAHVTIHHHRADGSEYPVVNCPIYATLEDGRTRTVRDEVFWRKDGTSFPVEYVASGVTDRHGSQIGAIVAFRDVSERVEQEQAIRSLNASLEQRVAERTAELRLERAKLSAAFDNMELGVIMSDAKGDDITMNAAAERMHGFASRADMHSRLASYAQDWELRDNTGRLLPFAEWPLPRALRGDYCRELDLQLHNLRSGHKWDGSYTCTPVPNDLGETSRIIITVMDITGRRRAAAEILALNATLEQRVQERTLELARTSSALEAMRDGVFMFSPDTLRFFFVNDGAQRQVGYSREELLAMTPLSIKPTFTEAQFRDMVAPLLEGREQVLNFTTLHRHKDGTEVPVEINLQMAGEGTQRCFVALCRDVTERQRAEAALADFKAATDEHAIVAITDARGKITYVNDKFCAISKYAREELLGQDHRIINSGHHPKAFIRELWETITSGRVWKGEIKNRAKDGSDYWVDTTIVPFLGEDGKPTQFIAIRADITKRKLAEDTLRTALTELSRANAELDEASRLKDEFLANMSHELRTPLNAILGLSEALLEQTNATLTPRQVKSITTISTSGQHLLALINDILDLSKIEAGKLELHPEPLNVDEFCQSCLVFVRTQAMQKQISVAFEHDGRAASLSADSKRLKQILVNLLTNAVKFTPQGGRIGLSVAAPEGEDVMRFTVWDSGIGIAPADQAKLFQAFTQIDSGLSRAQEGTGLGLALVARLVELHGGSVSLASEPGQGSRFTVTLPLPAGRSVAGHPQGAPGDSPGGDSGGTVILRRSTADAPATVSPVGGPPASPGQVFRRALIIEDDPTAAEQLVHYLGELGVANTVVMRGEEAVAAVVRERPDVILLDILLPNESGWVVLARLKEHPHTRSIPVAVVSVVDEPEKSLAMGAAAHFTKPVTREQLAKFLGRPVVSKKSDTEHIRRANAAVTAPAGPAILLAEDNEANIQTIGDYLQDKGYAMHYALNGLVAVKRARDLRPALVLMDIQMPVMDGLTAIKELRADAAFNGTPIIALTALAMAGDRERCLAAGATDYMSKPVKLKELAALVEGLLKRDA